MNPLRELLPVAHLRSVRRMGIVMLVGALATPAFAQSGTQPVSSMSGTSAFEVQAKKKGKKGAKKKNAGKKASAAQQQ